MQAIAHYMVRNDDSVISEDDALAVTQAALRSFPAVSENDAPVVLKALIERSGVLREQKSRVFDFVHNTIKEFLASEIFVSSRDVSTLARRATDDAWKQIVLFASSTRDRKFATRLVKKIIELTEETTDAALARRLRLAAVSCRYAALHMDPEIVQVLTAVETELIPPRNMNDAEALAGSGDNVVPLLTHKRRYNAREAAACVRALRLIGTDAAKRLLDEYVSDRRLTVATELAQTINPLRLAVIREQLVRNEPLPFALSRQITDLKPLSEINGVERLSLKGAPINDCEPLSSIVSLRSLDLSQTNVESLTALSSLTNLEELDISYTGVTDLTPLRSLPVLQQFSCSATHVDDLTPLAGNRRLRRLAIAGSEVSDLQPLAHLQDLEELDISELPLLRWSTLGGLRSLRQIRAYQGTAVDLGLLSGLPNITRLILNASDIENISQISRADTLEELWISFTAVSDIQPLSGLKGLKELALIGLEIEDFRHLALLPALQTLWLDQTRFSDLAIVTDCKELIYLSIENTQVDDLSPLLMLPKLQTLSVSSISKMDAEVLAETETLRRIIVRRKMSAAEKQILTRKSINVYD